jgi:hypothetical protein
MPRARDLYIVATDRRKLYDLFRRQFATDPHVEVILDRRTGERRAARGNTPQERRRADRRQSEHAHLLVTLGVALVSRALREEIAQERAAGARPVRAGKKPSRRGRGA